jgi:hypothetical protein
MTHRILARVAVWLGVASVPAYFLAFAALQDIYHGEADLTLEWRALRLSFLIFLSFHAVALVVLLKLKPQER